MNKAQSKETILKAILGPTNTGKTFYAMDRMLLEKIMIKLWEKWVKIMLHL